MGEEGGQAGGADRHGERADGQGEWTGKESGRTAAPWTPTTTTWLFPTVQVASWRLPLARTGSLGFLLGSSRDLNEARRRFGPPPARGRQIQPPPWRRDLRHCATR